MVYSFLSRFFSFLVGAYPAGEMAQHAAAPDADSGAASRRSVPLLPKSDDDGGCPDLSGDRHCCGNAQGSVFAYGQRVAVADSLMELLNNVQITVLKVVM